MSIARKNREVYVINWSNIPNEIPGHYNYNGEIDKMTNKNSLIILSVIAIIMYLFFILMERIPKVWNTGGVKITESNKVKVYRISKNLLVSVKLIVVSVFSYLTMLTASGMNVPVIFVPIFLIIIFGTIIYFLVKLLTVK